MTKNINDLKEQEEIYRFMQDLEFVQSLSNPKYLEYLSEKGYFEEKEFINYIKYLQYFNKSYYKKYITYPNSLLFLHLLQFESFREEIKNKKYIDIYKKSYMQILDEFIIRDWQTQNLNNK